MFGALAARYFSRYFFDWIIKNGKSSSILLTLSVALFFCFQVWNANNGHLLNKLEPVEENEVTGIISLPEKSKIITVGWNRKILVYYDDIQVRNTTR